VLLTVVNLPLFIIQHNVTHNFKIKTYKIFMFYSARCRFTRLSWIYTAYQEIPDCGKRRLIIIPAFRDIAVQTSILRGGGGGGGRC